MAKLEMDLHKVVHYRLLPADAKLEGSRHEISR